MRVGGAWKEICGPKCFSFVTPKGKEESPTKISRLVQRRSRFLCVLCVCALDLTCPLFALDADVNWMTERNANGVM